MNTRAQKNWDESFDEQIETHSYNTAPVEALVRTASYFLRARYPLEEYKNIKLLEMGCGGGINLIWAAEKGIRVSGIDISPVALDLGRRNLIKSGYSDLVDELVEGSVADTPFEDNSFDIIFESCVFQHLNKQERKKTFNEVKRILRPGGAFVGHMLDRQCSVYEKQKDREDPEDLGTLFLEEEGGSKIHLQNIGIAHFFNKPELEQLLSEFSYVDCCLARYELPQEEAHRRGFKKYIQSMWVVYALK